MALGREKRFEGVVIAGAGPVGLTAAVALAQKGVPVRVFEKGLALSRESRASTFHPSSLEILHELGLVDQLLSAGVTVPSFQFRDRYRGLIAQFNYSVLEADTNYAYRIQFEQSKLTPLLLQELSGLKDAEVLFGHEVVHARIEAERSIVVTINSDEGEWTLECPYLIGADGAGSKVRKSAGIDFEGLTYPERYLVVSTMFEFSEVIPDLSYVNYIADPEEWFALLRTPDHWRATFPLEEQESDDQANTDSAIQRRLSKIHPLADGYEVVHTNIYRVHRRVANKFSVGGVVLIGDAAHVNNPLGGLGMNSGILDAFFLAGVLHDVWMGREDEKKLQEFGLRHKHVAENVIGKQSNYNWVALRETDEKERLRQHQELREVASDDDRTRDYLLNASLLRVLWSLQSSRTS